MHGLLPMEVLMTMHSDHHVTENEDAAFDKTMKIIGFASVLLVAALLGLWLFSA